MNRITVEPEPGDQFLVFQLKQRPPEGVVLSAEELELFGHTWSIMEYKGAAPSGAKGVSRKEFCVLLKRVNEIRRELDHRREIGELMTLYPY